MGYFRELPNLEYPSFLSDANSSTDYLVVKNLFRRFKIRDDFYKLRETSILIKYTITDGSRPDLVAEELYGSPDYDWVVLISAGIINIRDQWPLSERDIYRFSANKYGENNLTDIKYYETLEVRDSENRLVLPAGKIVDPDFSIPDPNNKLATLNPVTAVTNYEHEVRLNEKKRTIRLLEPLYLQQFVNDMRELMIYSKSSEFVDIKLIRTDNMRIKSP
jgi:hypothetical protein